MILMNKDFKNTWGIVAPKSGRIKNVSELLDNAVMPGVQGGPLMHVIAGKAVAYGEALKPEFKEYCNNIVNNAQILSEEIRILGYDLVSKGTDTHLLLIDLSKHNISGKVVEEALENAGITTNKNLVPFDKRSPMITSGIRIGTPAITTRGMSKLEMKKIAKMIDMVIKNYDNNNIINKIKNEVVEMCKAFPIY